MNPTSASAVMSNLDLKYILDNSYDLIIITNEKGKILMVNSAVKRILNVKPEEIIGKKIDDLIRKGYYDRSVTLKAAKSRKIETGLVKTCTGKLLIVTSNPIFDDKNNLRFIFTNTKEQELVNDYLQNIEYKNIKLRTEIDYFRDRNLNEEELVYKSKCMKEVVDEAKRVALFDANVLITGETGTGKDLLAKFIHRHSRRAEESFVPINCAAIPEHLMESELFGYEYGAFSGASSKGKSGLLEVANNGTLFLDEVAELPLSLQAKLLRVLESKEIMRLGGTKIQRIDVRLICATNKNLRKLVHEGKFREDLYFRLNVVHIKIPPLRDRKEDIKILSDHFIRLLNQKYGTRKKLSERAIRVANDYEWPGNVRELKNVIERLVICSTKDVMECRVDIRKDINNKTRANINLSEEETRPNPCKKTLKEIRRDSEREYIMKIMNQTNWKVSEASKILGIHRTVLWKKMKEYNIEKP